ncbi:hypothetical protein L6164_004488 [Bauhinia variegata]|uniref:Uncharacterized protein n=1 Tax=Bauhinia variegata TaxID=167791 RepID=A0ACB9Q6S2_BAUVA|nr:hypothetical protein L6164_004488 [Bauhinia variegata]
MGPQFPQNIEVPKLELLLPLLEVGSNNYWFPDFVIQVRRTVPVYMINAMLISSTVIYIAFYWQKASPTFQLSGNSNSQEPNKQVLRSCLFTEEKKRERKNKKKKVKFAENVKEESVIQATEEHKEEQRKPKRVSRSCRNEIPEIRRMPANRIALYNGILRDRVNRMQCSY